MQEIIDQNNYLIYEVKVKSLINSVNDCNELAKLINNKCRWTNLELTKLFDFIKDVDLLLKIDKSLTIYLLHPYLDCE